jgi:tyrosinase
VYWLWQSKDLKARLKDISGPIQLMGPITGPNVTLAFPISLGPLAKEVTIKDLMDIDGRTKGKGVLSYLYD